MEESIENIGEPEKTSGIKGLAVVTRKEGKFLGKILDVYVSKTKNQLSGLLLKDEFWSKKRVFIPEPEIESIGEDVILISSEESIEPVVDVQGIVDQSVNELKGHWVTTKDGKHLGQFLDINFDHDTWKISEILMYNDMSLSIEPSLITLGSDEIIVPRGYESRLKTKIPRASRILSLVFGNSTQKESSADGTEENLIGTKSTVKKVKNKHSNNI